MGVNKSFYLQFGSAFLGLMLCVVLASIFIRSKIDAETKYNTKMESKVGGKVVIQKDTLMITNYSYWRDEFTLENGKKVSPSLVKKMKLH